MNIVFVEDLMATGMFRIIMSKERVKDFVDGHSLVIAKFKDNVSEDFGVIFHLEDLDAFIASLPRDAGKIEYVDEKSKKPVFYTVGNHAIYPYKGSRLTEEGKDILLRKVNDYRYGYCKLKLVPIVPLTAYENMENYFEALA